MNVYSFEQALEINEFVGLKFCGNVSAVMSSPAADILMYVKIYVYIMIYMEYELLVFS